MPSLEVFPFRSRENRTGRYKRQVGSSGLAASNCTGRMLNFASPPTATDVKFGPCYSPAIPGSSLSTYFLFLFFCDQILYNKFMLMQCKEDTTKNYFQTNTFRLLNWGLKLYLGGNSLSRMHFLLPELFPPENAFLQHFQWGSGKCKAFLLLYAFSKITPKVRLCVSVKRMKLWMQCNYGWEKKWYQWAAGWVAHVLSLSTLKTLRLLHSSFPVCVTKMP